MASIDRDWSSEVLGEDRRRAFRLGLVAIGIGDAVFLILLCAGFFVTHRWFEEDGPVEDLQAAVLLVTAFVVGWQAIRQRREGRIIDAGLAALFLACFAREMELRGTGAPDWLVWFFYGTGQNITIATIFAAFAVCYVRRWREIPDVIAAFLHRRTLIYLAAGIILLLSGVAESAESVLGYAHEVVEEWMELNGYLLFLLASLFHPYRDPRVSVRELVTTAGR